MGKKSSSDDVGGSNETTEATLAALTMQISKFVSEGTLDSRFAAPSQARPSLKAARQRRRARRS